MLMSRNVNNDVTMNPPIRARRQMASGVGSLPPLWKIKRETGEQRMQLRREKGKAVYTTSFFAVGRISISS